jgi:copper chaperone CopZ
MQANGEERVIVRWHVPALDERPVVGTSCCIATAEAIIAQELSLFPGIDDVAVDLDRAVVEITFQPALVSEAELRRALAEIGYAAQPS